MYVQLQGMWLDRLARPLLACAWISFVYLLHGRLLRAWYVHQSHYVHGSKARCTRNFKVLCTILFEKHTSGGVQIIVCKLS